MKKFYFLLPIAIFITCSLLCLQNNIFSQDKSTPKEKQPDVKIPYNEGTNNSSIINEEQIDAVSSGYSFASSQATVLGTTSNDDDIFSALNIGFTFTFRGTAYSQFGVCANGWIYMGGTVGSSTYTPLSSGSTNYVISALGRDIQGQTGSALTYQTIGTSPNRVLIVSWVKYRKWNQTGDNYNFEIRLFETSNAIEISYGTMVSNTSATTVQAGLRGNSTSDYNNRTTTTNWSATTAGTINTASCTLNQTVYPLSGVTFRWTGTTPVSSYTFAYANATTVGTTSNDDEIFSARNIGFTFTFDGAAYTQFGLCANGWIYMGGGAGTSTYYPISSGTTNNIISALANDIQGQSGTSLASSINYRTIGTASNRILLVNWTGYKKFGTGGSGDNLNFQIRLFEGTNSIQFVYGAFTVNATPQTMQAGLRGASNGDYNNRTTTTSWAATTAGTINSATCTMSSTVFPAGGQLFTWTPAVSTPKTLTSITYNQASTAGVNIGSTNNEILRLDFLVSGNTGTLNLNSIVINYNGTSAADISGVKLYRTATTTFSSANQLGTTQVFSGGNASFSSLAYDLPTGATYIWVTYDISGSATAGNTADGQVLANQINVAGSTYPSSSQSPAGSRTIQCASTVGTGVLTAGYPFYTYYMDSKTDMLYTASEISATACAGGCKYITGIGFNIALRDAGVMNGFNIKMQNTSASSISAFTTSGWTTVYSGTYAVPATGWQFITFTTPFAWDGTSNVLIEICFNNSGYTSNSTVYSSATAANTVFHNFEDMPEGDGCTDAMLYNSGTPTTRPNCQFIIGSSPPAMSFSSSTCAQPNTSGVATGTLNAEIISIQVVTSGLCSPMLVTNFNLSTNGSTNAAGDLSAAKIFYTGTSSTFASSTQFGSTLNSPNGSFSIAGSQSLTQGTNYFWLAYNISGSAANGNVVDGECSSVSVAGIGRVPAVTAPAGNRTVLAPLSGAIMVGTSQTYTTLTGSGGLFEAINNVGLAGNTTVYITSNITEPGTNALNQWAESGTGGYTLSIYPLNASEKILSGSVADAMIRFNGTDRVTIDGNGELENDAAGSKYLRFRNTNGSNPAFSFINDSKNNTITDCYIESNNTSTAAASAGTVYFGGTTGTSGNDSNTISYCDIRDRSDAAGLPVYAVFSSGTATTTTHYNSNINIDNCNIYNFFNDAGAYYAGVWLDAGTTDWNITNNSMYQTASRTQNTNANVVYIFNNYGTANNLTVQGNYIGGTAPQCGGTALSYSGTGLYTFQPIYLYVAAAASSNIQGNIIQNINLATNQNDTGHVIFYGIRTGPTSGSVNIGTVSGNTIGASTGTGSITINSPLATTASFTAYGIYQGAAGNVSNNSIGSVTLSGSSAGGSSSFYGISGATFSSSTFTISNNLVGSLTTANSIQQTGTARPHSIRGITATINSTGTMNISNNTIANITDYNTSLSYTSSVYGIQNNGGSGIYNITGNTIRDIANGCGVTGFILLNGINCTGTGTKTISQNNIYNLLLNQPGAGNGNLTGILAGGSPGGGTISRNMLYNLVSSNSGTSQSIYGIYTTSSTNTYTISNNMMSITNGDAALDMRFKPEKNFEHNGFNNKLTDKNISVNSFVPSKNNNVISTATESIESEPGISSPVTDQCFNSPVMGSNNKSGTLTSSADAVNGMLIYGMLNSATGPVAYYYNTAYIGGTQPGAAAFPSYTLYRSAGTMTLRNNLFINARTGGTGSHVVLGNLAGTPATGWTAAASNYNAFIGSNANTIGEWGSGVTRTIDTWRTSSGGDMQSWCTTTGSFSTAGLFNNLSAGDLTINPSNTEAWLVSGKGIAVTGQNIDYSGDSRFTAIASGTTDIGADEISTPPALPPNASVNNPPGPGITSTYTLWSRPIAVVTWGTGGSSYPGSLAVKYYTGVNPGNTIGGGYSNSYWNITPTGTLAGTNYDILFYFGDNETYSIGTPSSNTRLAKYDGTWEVFPSGSGNWHTQLTWNSAAFTYSVYVSFIDRFSDFALTDGSNPLPVQLSGFTASVSKRDVILSWVTEGEVNNAGFNIERREKIINSPDFGEWKVLGFIEGKGTFIGRSEYKYTNKKLNSGTYQYRIRQIDNNGNYEYFNLASPENVIIGKPVNADISQNYPNPSNPKSTIDYQIPYESKVNIIIYDLLGREITTLVNDIKKEGYYSAEFDGTNLASGTYFYRITIEGNNENFTKTLKMILVK